jgi:hypothetical protein
MFLNVKTGFCLILIFVWSRISGVGGCKKLIDSRGDFERWYLRFLKSAVN